MNIHQITGAAEKSATLTDLYFYDFQFPNSKHLGRGCILCRHYSHGVFSSNSLCPAKSNSSFSIHISQRNLDFRLGAKIIFIWYNYDTAGTYWTVHVLLLFDSIYKVHIFESATLSISEVISELQFQAVQFDRK